MSDSSTKLKSSKRRYSNEVAVAKQLRIAKAYGMEVKNPHRLAKHHVMNCGNPKCYLCSNPRHNGFTKDKLTMQEKRALQYHNEEKNLVESW
jgi:hypothetical protein